MRSSDTTKKIFYCGIIRKEVVLVDFTETKGNQYREFTQGLLKKIKTGRHMLEFEKYVWISSIVLVIGLKKRSLPT